MEPYFLIKTVHVISATVLFGTGLGTAFFMFRSRNAVNLQSRLDTARTTVLADYLFTLPAVILQPITGVMLIVWSGYDPFDFWLVASYGLFVLAGLCWLPVVWIQIRLRNMLAASLRTGAPLPEAYRRLLRVWFILGWPAFGALIVVFFLMAAKPPW